MLWSGAHVLTIYSATGIWANESTVDREAQWIWQEQDGPANTWVAFRKKFELQEVPEAASGEEQKKPNVIYILADDLGIGDLSIYGQEKLKTPNIDQIGLEGMRFVNHYSGNTVCSPSRAVLMTGQHPGHVHCRGNGDENAFALSPDMTTLPRLFKNAGYATGVFGKWGLGQTGLEGDTNPMTHGFDQFLAQLPRLWKQGEVRPSHQKVPSNGRDFRTRKDPFEGAWPGVLTWLEKDPDATAKTLFQRLQKEQPGKYSDGQLRTLQRRIREWRHIMAKQLIYNSSTS